MLTRGFLNRKSWVYANAVSAGVANSFGVALIALLMSCDVSTVEGSTLSLGTTERVQVNDATVILADVKASNGVTRVIGKVILSSRIDVASL